MVANTHTHTREHTAAHTHFRCVTKCNESLGGFLGVVELYGNTIVIDLYIYIIGAQS
jgi:hypothetical protein